MDFLKDFEKEVAKLEGVTNSSEPPRYWHTFGNYVMNYIMSGNFTHGIPQGRLTGLAGPSGAGKSFVLGNIIKNAQKDGAFVFVIDSENALDNAYMESIGVDVEKNYKYKSVNTIPQVTKLVSAFMKHFTSSYGYEENAPQILIAIDSLDMLMTETETEHYGKGVTKGDQGQRNKQLKAMLRTFVQDIKNKNVSLVFTSQVYRNQDLTNGEGVWIVSDAVRYSASQIALLTKLRLKGEGAGVFEGIQMKCMGFKTRFTKPFQSITLEVPYSTGIDPFSGLLDAAVNLGVVVRTGNSFYIKDEGESTKAAERNLSTAWYERVLNKLSTNSQLILSTDKEEDSNQIDNDV